MPAVNSPADGFVGKVKDVTGPGLTDRWGMACTDLGASVRAAEAILERAAQDPEVTMLLVGGAWMSRFGQELLVGQGRVADGGGP